MTNTTTKMMSGAVAIIAALATFSIYAFSAAAYNGYDSDGTDINVSNSAQVTNNSTVEANTGRNDADGAAGGRGGEGGDAYRGDGGNGGNGGRGGDAGSVTTGPATAYSTIYNDVNSTRVTTEDDCACGRYSYIDLMLFDGDNENDVDIDTHNRARVTNDSSVVANTGGNEALGGAGGRGGNGGDANDYHMIPWQTWFYFWSNDDGGNGGNGNIGGAGGSVVTGSSYADSLITNVVNETVVRTRRGAEPMMVPVQ